MTIKLGRYGVWRPGQGLSPRLAAELDGLGFGTLWIGTSPAGDLRLAEELLDATTRIVVGTSIVNVWNSDPTEVARAYRRVDDKRPGRFVLGIGIGHPERSVSYTSPYQSLVEYLDVLDAGGVPVDGRMLAALGPRVLGLARDRAAGALPYLVPVAHTRSARAELGPDKLLVVEQKVVIEADAAKAREIGRDRLRTYLALQNYTNNLRRFGYTDDDLGGGGSDRLVDDLVVHGTQNAVAEGLRAHLEAGADQVVAQVLTRSDDDLLDAYRQLAAALGT